MVNLKRRAMEAPSVLALLASREECESLQRILSNTEWGLRFAFTLQHAEALLRTFPIGVVICGTHLADGHCWRDLLNKINRMPVPLPLIVADRLADERLWAEVLNLGCYDLLMMPFEAEEVLRVLRIACDFGKRELGRATGAKPEELPLLFPGKALAAVTD